MTEPKSDDAMVTKPVVAKAVGKKTEVSEAVTVPTKSFTVSDSSMVDAAKDLFLAQIKETYGDVPVSDVRLIKVNHHVGKSAEYHFSAVLGG